MDVTKMDYDAVDPLDEVLQKGTDVVRATDLGNIKTANYLEIRYTDDYTYVTPVCGDGSKEDSYKYKGHVSHEDCANHYAYLNPDPKEEEEEEEYVVGDVVQGSFVKGEDYQDDSDVEINEEDDSESFAEFMGEDESEDDD